MKLPHRLLSCAPKLCPLFWETIDEIIEENEVHGNFSAGAYSEFVDKDGVLDERRVEDLCQKGKSVRTAIELVFQYT